MKIIIELTEQEVDQVVQELNNDLASKFKVAKLDAQLRDRMKQQAETRKAKKAQGQAA